MKRIEIHHTQDLVAINGLLFFTESLEELLFVHANDSFKAPALNTFTRTIELERLLVQARSSKRTKSLLHVVEELKWSIEQDPVIQRSEKKKTIRDLINLIANQLQSSDLSSYLPELSSTTRALQLALSDYSARMRDLINELIINGNEKDSLSHLAANLVVQLEADGFSKRFIHYVTQRTLVKELSGRKPASPQKAITKFFKHFNTDPNEFEVAFKGADDSKQLSNYPDIQMSENIDSYSEKDKLQDPTLDKFFIITLKAKDPISARDSAVRQLKTYSSISKFFSHRLSQNLSERCIVRNKLTKKEVVVDPPVSAMVQGTERLTDSEADNKIIEVANALARLDTSSRRRLVSALQYHREAIDSQALENQLVDLWAALEGFIPQPLDDQPRIHHYIDHLLPALALTYTEKIFRYIAQSLFHCDKRVTDIISGVNLEGSFTLKAAAVILCDEMSGDRDEVCKLLSNHPLLRFRMFRVYNQFHTAGKGLATLNSHKNKLNWHLNRIYNTRNSIMHSATSLPYLETLVENLHTYLDILINSVVQIASKSLIRTDINAILKMLSAEERAYLSQLKEISDAGDHKLTPENISNVIFGRSNPLIDMD